VGPRNSRFIVHCWAGVWKKQLVVTGDSSLVTRDWRLRDARGRLDSSAPENLVNHNAPSPMFFVSVDSKEFNVTVSLLESILVR